MNGKKLAARRIAVFIAFAFGLSWLPWLLCRALGFLQSEAGFQLRTNFMMFTPAAGALLTRLVTKEGMANSYLRLNFKGNGKFYLLAFVLPFVYCALELLFYVVFLGAGIASGAEFEAVGVTPVGYGAAIFSNIANAAALFPIFMGEELGWRGYLYPKLKEVLNRPAAYAVGGIIWGLWHAPAIIDGLNFGKEYTGYPYVGILLMCLSCVPTGVIFMWLTEKTGSAYPAAFAHGVNNNAAGMITSLAVLDAGGDNIVKIFLVAVIAEYIVAAVCLTESMVSKKRVRN
ncbi:MAG: CPBP family intramembrane metalloprotease [Ruminococcus sp.]|nr:CPBP family intramembrane metalloprotease [Ruminococcus sp.]MCM1381592.1 CPBP family intramembrane metalloprotease [Muribaculaceae bacterium]MCM1478650.1 CPBP family intramembrane metalloprotease [Muribaculaceae bacterium]